ncbi:MAG: MFS transporter [Holophagales bacterium]|nr:MFS transporter [Holophagales bacterium]
MSLLLTLPLRFLRAYREAYQGLPPTVWWLSTVILVNRCGTMVVPFLALYLTQELDHPVTAAGFVLSAYGFGHLAGAALGGWTTDRFGPLPVQVASLAISGFAFLALEPLRSVSSIAAVTFLAATAAEGFRPANYAALASYAPKGLQTRAVALNRLAINLGWGIAPVVGGILASLDYRWLIRGDGATCLLAAALMVWLLVSGRLPMAPTRECHADPVETADERSGSASGGGGSPADPPRHPARDGAFLAFLGVAALSAFIFFQAWGAFPVYLAEAYGIAEARYGALMAVNALLILAFEMVLTVRTERYHPLSVVGVGCIFTGLGFAILPLGRGVALAALSVAVWTVGEMLSHPALGGWVAARASARHRGKYMGLFTMSWGVAFIAAPAVGTWVYERLSPETLWVLLGVLGFVGWAACELLRRRLQASTPTAPRA